MKLKHILPPLAALLLAFLCGCDTTPSKPLPESDTRPVTEETSATEDTTPPETETETEAHVHTLTETVTPPTCETEGYTRLSCDCGYTYDTNHTPPTGHTLTETVTPPTCESEGYTRLSCDCGYTYDANHTPPTGHALTETVTPPTCESEGYTRLTCDCGYTYDTNHIPPTGHTLTETVTPPSCEAEGYTRLTCDCGYTYDTNHTPPTGHTLTETVTPPTCEIEGYTRHTCDCGYTFDTHHIPPIGHDFTVTVTAPTCTESGYTHYQCGACAHAYDTDRVPPISHANATATRFYPTIHRDGYTLHTCPDCGYSYEDSLIKYADIVTGAYADGTDVLMQGVDTSKWNHEYGASLEDIKPLDWEALKAAGMDFVILKAGSSKGIDPAFELDYRDAKAAGLQVGAYFYTYSTTAEDTLADAEMLLSWLEGKQFELPIYFDAEDATLMSLDGETLTTLCKTFVGRLQEAGYYAALYTNTEWLYNLLDTEWVKANLDVWYARYTAALPEGQEHFSPTDRDFAWKDGTAYKPGETDKRFGLWQYTDNGGVEGFRYPFDFNFAFKDYKAIMMKWGLNGYGMPNPLPEPSIV